MFISWNNTRRGQLGSYTTIVILVFLSVSIGLASISDANAFPIFKCVRNRIYDFNRDGNFNLSYLLIIFISTAIYFFVLYFLLMGLRILLGNFLKSDIGINIQFKILKTRLGSYVHGHRLGYIMNLAFWGDIIQFLAFGVLYIKSYTVLIASGHLDNGLYIAICLKVLIGYVPIILMILYFSSIINPIKTHSIKYLNTQKTALILYESKLPQSSSSMPPNRTIYTEWFVLDEYEYKYLTESEFSVDLSLIIVNIEQDCNMAQLEYLLQKYEAYYMKPHLISILCLDISNKLDWDEIRIDKNCFDFCYKYNCRKSDLNPSINILRKVENISSPTNSKEVISLLNILPPEMVNYYNRLCTSPPCIYKFYKKILNIFSLRQAVNGLFDIIDLTLRLSVIACSSTIDDNSQRIVSSMGSFSKMRKLLKEYKYVNFEQTLYINILDQGMRMLLWEKLQINIPNNLDFDSLLRIIENLRNVTKAHGFIKDSELRKMFRLMFCLSLYVFFIFEICSVSIYFESNEKRPILKFKGKLIESFGDYALFDSDDNLFIATNNGKFINMLTGEIRNLVKK